MSGFPGSRLSVLVLVVRNKVFAEFDGLCGQGGCPSLCITVIARLCWSEARYGRTLGRRQETYRILKTLSVDEGYRGSIFTELNYCLSQGNGLTMHQAFIFSHGR